MVPLTGLGRGYSPQQKSRRMCMQFWKNIIIFITTTPTDINPSHVLHMVGMRLHAKFRHRTTRRLGVDRPQTK